MQIGVFQMDVLERFVYILFFKEVKSHIPPAHSFFAILFSLFISFWK